VILLIVCRTDVAFGFSRCYLNEQNKSDLVETGNPMKNTRLFDDLAELAGGAVGVLSGLREQLGQEAKERMSVFSSKMAGGAGDDLRRIEGMIIKARTTQEDILKRLGAIEEILGLAKKESPKKPATKKTTKKSTKTPKRKTAGR
jgi:hypothetical protein